ncbi:LRR receptor-like serine/threonine-protein kinase FLS2 [Gossypium australe]|uniref:LRR receptor-like serine/threonine-protein kinase FLS2 n=1 Tax=Gossypium australe TaxID=47621 RepID=A0A5B6VTG4_9ROSI|nr:LRR receptor-like serine/threonine-protein kinase FLS2 [Gossypium australe]
MFRFEPNSSWTPPFQCESVELGSLSDLVCNSSEEGWMGSLYIDANLLSGEILDCWNHRFLNYLDSENNNLTGKIAPSLLHKDLRLLNLQKIACLENYPPHCEILRVCLFLILVKIISMGVYQYGLLISSQNLWFYAFDLITSMTIFLITFVIFNLFKTWTLPITTIQELFHHVSEI